MNPLIVGVIQARMDSQRLPGKVLRPMNGKPMLQGLIERCRRSKHLSRLCVATGQSTNNDEIVSLCRALSTVCHRGSDDDVLGRMLCAARAEQADVMLRLTGDNPLVDGELIDLVIERYLGASPRPDYVHTHDGTGFPPGLTVELVTMAAMEEANASADPLDREHVTYFIRQRPHHYRHCAVISPFGPSARPVTVDTMEDFTRVEMILRTLSAGGGYASIADIIGLDPTTT